MSFIKKFEVRWSEIDANRHMIHTAYSSYMVETRMAFFKAHHIDISTFERLKIGPVILNEHMHYIKEIYPGEEITVNLKMSGMSGDGMFLRFDQSLFNTQGLISAFARILISWISFEGRSLCPIPQEWMPMLSEIEKTNDFTILHKSDTRFDYVPYRDVINPT